MKRLIVLLLLWPAQAFAQEASIALGGAAVVEATQAASAAAAKSDPGVRRRPSMVGYIDDSEVSSKVRVRYDAGYGMTVPDRGEFFYAKCGCYRGLPTTNAAYDPNAPGPGPGIVSNLNFGQLYILGEYAPTERFSVFAQLPFRFLRPDTFVPGTGSFPSANGISDLQIGAKAGLISTAGRQLTATLQIGTPTGDALKGLGTNHTTIEPSLLYEERPSDRLAIAAEFGDIIPIGGSAGVPTSTSDSFASPVFFYGIGPSYEAYRSRRFTVAPIVELVGWSAVGGFQTPSGDDSATGGWNIVNLKFGARILFDDRSSIYVGYGHALTNDAWYTNIVRLEYRRGFGR